LPSGQVLTANCQSRSPQAEHHWHKEDVPEIQRDH